MNVDFTKLFNKQFEKLPRKRQKQAKAAIALFLEDITATSLLSQAILETKKHLI